MDNETIVNSIKNLCKKNNITIGQLEKEVRLSQGLVSKWKDKTPSLDKIVDIADYFHVSLDEVVGRNQNLNDEFLDALCKQTDNNILVWNSFESEQNTNAIKPGRNIYNSREVFDEDVYHAISYFSKFGKGYITVYCFCKYDKSLSPNDLVLYIQADDHSSIIRQDYSPEQLMPLWVKVLKQLSDEAPDDVKAEDLKNNFIRAANTEVTSNTKENKTENANQILNNPSITKIMETMSTPEMIGLRETLSKPEFQNMIQTVSKIQKKLNGE